MGDQLSRRDVFVIAGSAGVAAALPSPAPAQPAPAAPMAAPEHPRAVENEPLVFFNNEEAAFISAVIDKLIPADEKWPGALGCGILTYIDRQLAGAYGAGARLFLDGPWKSGTPQQGYQLPYTPAELYRAGVEGARKHLSERYGGRRLDQLDGSEQEAFIKAMEAGALNLGDVPSAVFFETLLANTIEGFLADPAYGGNRDMAAWRMIGFPGAYAQYVTLVEYHGMRFDQPPISMAQAEAHGHADVPHGPHPDTMRKGR